MNQWAEQGDQNNEKPKESTPEINKTTAWAEQTAKIPSAIIGEEKAAPKSKAKAKAKPKTKEA